MTRTDVARWLDGYVEAWRSNDPALIRALFTDDAEYRYHPWDDPVRGAEAIAAAWLEDPDEPDAWEAAYEPWAVDGQRAVATGTSRYHEGSGDRVFHNAFLLAFAPDGRCASFTELFVQQPAAASGG